MSRSTVAWSRRLSAFIDIPGNKFQSHKESNVFKVQVHECISSDPFPSGCSVQLDSLPILC